MAGKRDPEQELEAQRWIEAVLGERFPPGKLINFSTWDLTFLKKNNIFLSSF